MKRFFIFIVISLLGSTIYAQTERITRFEGEAYIGITLPISDYFGGSKKIGVALGAEGRYNFVRSHFDIGAACFITTVNYGFALDDDADNLVICAAVSDYNFKQGKKINPFAGLGLGVGFGSDDDWIPSGSTHFSVMAFIPRIGVEFYRHLRLTLSSNITKKSYHNVSLTVGFVIGGGKK